MRNLVLILAAALTAGACASTSQAPAANWWKGNLHTHSLWTDGADFPEMIASWYRDNGYNFLAITEHDMLQEGERWVDINAPDQGWPPRNASTRTALPAYREKFGAAWLQERVDGTSHSVRLRALSEYRHMFETPNQFLFIMAEEITDKGGAHINAFNLDRAILPRGGETAAARIRNNLDAVSEQRRVSSRPIISIINHPNYVWALTAQEIAAIPDARLFEVYNGHQMVNNAGDSTHPSTERMWDIMLTQRIKSSMPVIYGVATDDAHEYRAAADGVSMPGRGWVMVRAARLAPDEIVNALAGGEFYASTGVTLSELRRNPRGIALTIATEPGVTYRTQFIGTRENSSTTGEVLAEIHGPKAEYRIKGDEMYVRAVVISSKPHRDPLTGKLLAEEKAWIQPITPQR